MQKGTSFHRPRQSIPQQVSADDPALTVMTDFKVVTAYTAFPLDNIEDTRAHMIHHGVRSLLVVDEQNAILGLVTATDLSSERPMQVIRAQGIRHADVLVKDIMTPRERLDVISVEDMNTATVGDIVATLKTQGRQHALVAEGLPDRSQILRGMFSATQIGRLLGTTIDTVAVARTFAEIGEELAKQD